MYATLSRQPSRASRAISYREEKSRDVTRTTSRPSHVGFRFPEVNRANDNLFQTTVGETFHLKYRTAQAGYLLWWGLSLIHI